HAVATNGRAIAIIDGVAARRAAAVGHARAGGDRSVHAVRLAIGSLHGIGRARIVVVAVGRGGAFGRTAGDAGVALVAALEHAVGARGRAIAIVAGVAGCGAASVVCGAYALGDRCMRTERRAVARRAGEAVGRAGVVVVAAGHVLRAARRRIAGFAGFDD